MKIKHVYGNVLRIDIPLTIKIINSESGQTHEVEEPFYPNTSKPVLVELVNQYNITKYAYEATIDGNVAHIEDYGNIRVGVYKVTVKCFDEYNQPYRYMVRDIIEICDATIDAGVEAGIEFDSETYTLEGAYFIKGEKGDKGDDGITPHIDDTTGNWFVGDEDTGVHAQGERGEQGEQGEKGDTGEGVAAGGTTGQVLQKKSNTDYDTEWVNPPASGVSSVNGETGEVTLGAEDVGALPADTPIPDEQIQSDWNQSDNTKKDFIKNKPSIPSALADLSDDSAHRVVTDTEKTTWNGKQDTINDLSEIRSGAAAGATAVQTETDPTVPSWAKQSNKPSYNANEVGALPSSTKYGATLDMSLNTTDYTLTVSLKDQDGTVLNYKTVDFPIESVVVNGSYDSTNKKIVLTLQNGNTIDVPVGDLVAGLQTEITALNMLDADLVDDTNSTHKFVTTSEKSTWNAKYDKPASGIPASDLAAGVIPDISGKADKSEMSVVDGTGADSDKTTIQLKSGTSATVLKSHQSLAGKQDVIDAQHKLSADLVDDSTTTNKFTNATEKQTWNNKQDALVSGTNIKTINNESILGDGNITIQGGGGSQVQSDWNQSDNTAVDYIKNKPTIPEIPSNTAYLSNDSGEGIVPDDGIRAVTVTSAAAMTVNPDVVTVVNGAVGTAAITLQVPQDNLAHVWDIMMTTDSTVAITFVMSNSATILAPSGFSIGASKAVEISVIGVGTKYYLRYGEFA